MTDMLVKLYELPPLEPVTENLRCNGITIKAAIAPERNYIVKWVNDEFGSGWAGECETSFSNHPVSCFVALDGKKIVGFACYEATYKDFFGPTGVDPSYRGRGIGTGLLLSCMHALHAQGYGYAVIGGAGPVEYYKKTVKAKIIDDTEPGIYKNMIGKQN